MRLTDISVRALSPPEKGQKTYFYDTLPNFGCRVSQGGTRSFVVQHGTDRQLVTIGRYHPDILPLAKARAEAKRILAERVLGKHRPKSIPFDDAKTLFLEACKKKNRPKTVRDYTGIFRRHFTFGSRQLSDISTHDIDRKLDRIEGPSEKRYATVVAKLFFKWATRKHYLEISPCERIETPAKSPSRAHVLTDAELKLIWGTSDSVDLPAPFRTIVKLLILAGQRRGETAALRTPYIDGDIATFPATLTKNKREHIFPLSNLAAEILRAVEVDTTRNDAFFFPARGKPSKPFNGWSKSKATLDKLCGVTGWTLHDLRRTYRTIHARIGTPPHIAERLVNHVSAQTDMERIYDQYRYLPELKLAVANFEKEMIKILEQS
jgi:integrase